MSKKGGKKKAGTKKKVGSDDEPKISLSCENLGVELDVDIDEDISLEGLWDVLNVYDKEVFDEKERETYKLIQKELRVKHIFLRKKHYLHQQFHKIAQIPGSH